MGMASAPDSVEEAIEALKRGMPQRQAMTIHDNGNGNRINIMAEAMRESQASAGDSVDEWWFADKELLVIDLGEDDDN